MLSAPTSTDAAVNSFKSRSKLTVPLVPPPESPSPAVTPVMSAGILSTPTVAVIPETAIAVAKADIASFLVELSLASIIAMRSASTATLAAVNSLRSNANDTAPLEPPPDSPSPAVTLSMSPASLVKLNAPVPLL